MEFSVKISRRVSLKAAVLLLAVWLAPTYVSGGQGQTYVPPASPRIEIGLNRDWKFIRADADGAAQPGYDDSRWTSISVPHTWNALDGQYGGNSYYRGVGWYRRHFSVEAGERRNVYVEFEGVSLIADMWVNGVHIGQHRGGFATFRFDITASVRPGEDNVIAVKVDNARHLDVLPLFGDFTVFGGIYRPVRLILADPLSVDLLDYGSSGVYLLPFNVTATSAHLKITAKLRNGDAEERRIKVRSVVVDAANSIIQTLDSTETIAPETQFAVVQDTTIAKPHLWNGRADPYLYRVYLELWDGDTLTDLVSQPLGFRSFSIDPNLGFFLNGQYLDLHGVNKHQDRLDKGWAVSNADIDEDFAIISEIGANAIRLAHYQHSQHTYDLADRMGFVLWTEIPLIGGAMNTPAFTQNAKQQLIELIGQNYNHPSVMFWGLGNELQILPGNDPNPLLEQLTDLAHDEDPSRPTTSAVNGSDNADLNWRADLTGFNRYYGWYTRTIDDFPRWADQVHAKYPNGLIAASEYGAGASIKFHSDHPQKGDHTEEYQALFHEAYWLALQRRPFLWGKFVWVMFDFSADQRNEGDAPGRNDKGLVTYDRQTRKDAFYWYKANWTSDPFVYITSRRFTQRTNPLTQIKVYANTESVRLIVNGTDLGERTSSERLFVWTGVRLTGGENIVQAIGQHGGQTYRDTVTWTLSASSTP